MPEPDARTDVFVVGSLNMDLVVRTPRMPRPGETILGGPLSRFAGGKGNNQAVAAARAGAKAHMLGCIGNDAHGEELRATQNASGVDTSLVWTIENEHSGVAIITVDDAGENTIVVAPGANAHVDAAMVERARPVLVRSRVLLMQLEVPLETVAAAAGIARTAGVHVVLNAAPASALPEGLLANVDTLIVNAGEAALLAGAAAENSIEETARVLTDLGPRTVIITLGAIGVLAIENGQVLRQPSFRVDTIDTVGAGDAFCGAWAAATAAGADLAIALRFAAAAGALATTVAGAIPSLPMRAAIDALVREQSPQPTAADR
ncbi:MAG: ribokinase [Phycisphaeraceae bacterium]|nr:ribokinase [Phycisphaeraceae bacterium]MCW5762092.1 ribokinase [Phycisphaeraceae bacterium]